MQEFCLDLSKSASSDTPDLYGLNIRPDAGLIMRIAYCLPDFNCLLNTIKGTSSNAAYLLQGKIAAMLQARGHKLTFIAGRDLGDNVCTDDLENAKLALHTWSDGTCFHFLKAASWRIQRFLGVPYLNVFSNLRLYDACLRCLQGHDVVYERNGLYRNGVAMACRRLGIPYVLFVDADEILEHDYMNTPIRGILRWRAKAAFRYNLNAADCILCVSRASKANLINSWKTDSEKIVVMPNSVDVETFRPDSGARSKIRISLKMGNNPLILFVGSFYKWHDVETLLSAFAIVLESYPHARLVLVGDGATRHEMERLAAEFELGDAVRFIGSVPHSEVPGFAAAADIAVAPYPPLKQEMWLSPLKLFEYMASGNAIVACAAGQVSDVIQDEFNGLLVPPGNAPAMADALKRLIVDISLRMQLGRQAREDALKKHSWGKYISDLENVLDAARSGRRLRR
jgi:glycosyltransferase involved in cell wall biosynthesis